MFLQLFCFSRPRFRNLSEHSVVVCCCACDWTCSLWLPLSQVVARLLTNGVVVSPNSDLPLDAIAMRPGLLDHRQSAQRTFHPEICSRENSQASRRLVLRVYTGFVSSLGLWGGLLERACCMLEPGEQVDYDGGVTWPHSKWPAPVISGIISSFAFAKNKRDPTLAAQVARNRFTAF